jgi:hypothetical protein
MNKYGYKETRKLYMMYLMTLCKQENWYTKGNNQEYDNLLNMTKKDIITTDDIVEMATDIYEHSDMDNGNSMKDNMTNIMFKIASVCNYFFEEI